MLLLTVTFEDIATSQWSASRETDSIKPTGTSQKSLTSRMRNGSRMKRKREELRPVW